MPNYTWDWNVVAAIGTCAGALASFLTVLFAFLSNRQSNRLTRNQIKSMVDELNLLAHQNLIAEKSLKEAKEQTQIAKNELNLAKVEFTKSNYPSLNIQSIQLIDLNKLIETVKIQNQLISKICLQLPNLEPKDNNSD